MGVEKFFVHVTRKNQHVAFIEILALLLHFCPKIFQNTPNLLWITSMCMWRTSVHVIRLPRFQFWACMPQSCYVQSSKVHNEMKPNHKVIALYTRMKTSGVTERPGAPPQKSFGGPIFGRFQLLYLQQGKIRRSRVEGVEGGRGSGGRGRGGIKGSSGEVDSGLTWRLSCWFKDLKFWGFLGVQIEVNRLFKRAIWRL